MSRSIPGKMGVFILLWGVFIGLFILVLFRCVGAGESGAAKSGCAIYVVNPFSGRMILPDTSASLFSVSEGSGEKRIAVRACRGEFEPASFVMRSSVDMSGIHVVPSALSGPDKNTIPASAVDVRIVKCWYQAGSSVLKGTKTLVPELLLKDDTLVKVDEENGINYLKVSIEGGDRYIDISSPGSIVPSNAEVRDSAMLLPFDVAANTNKQIWLTLHVPDNATPGEYTGSVTLYRENDNLGNIEIVLTVLPFELEKPAIEYGIYYTPVLVRNTYGRSFSSLYKSTVQYKAELQNMRDHGVIYPTLHQGYSDLELLRKALSIRKEVGLPTDRIYTMALGVTTNYGSSDKLAGVPTTVAKWRTLLTEYGYTDFYLYGMDEAKGDTLRAQRTAWQLARNAGARIFAACYGGSIDIVGDLLDSPILSGAFKPDEVAKWHRRGKKVFIYGNPQVGVENPLVYRRNYGIPLVGNGYDGVMNFAYQYAFESSGGTIWNDFSNTTKYRNHVFAYPTSNGVIDTIQWEGFREGVDDVRYLSTLAKARNIMNISSLAASVYQGQDLCAVRCSIIDLILSRAPLSPTKLNAYPAKP